MESIEAGRVEGQAPGNCARVPVYVELQRDAVGIVRDKLRGLLATLLVGGFVWVAVSKGALTELQVLAASALGYYFGARSNGNGGAK
jgi:hypothetical protein